MDHEQTLHELRDDGGGDDDYIVHEGGVSDETTEDDDGASDELKVPSQHRRSLGGHATPDETDDRGQDRR